MKSPSRQAAHVKHPSGDLVPRDPRVGGSHTSLGHHVAVADAARCHADEHLTPAGLRHLPLDQLEPTPGSRNLDRAHRSPLSSSPKGQSIMPSPCRTVASQAVEETR